MVKDFKTRADEGQPMTRSTDMLIQYIETFERCGTIKPVTDAEAVSRVKEVRTAIFPEYLKERYPEFYIELNDKQVQG